MPDELKLRFAREYLIANRDPYEAASALSTDATEVFRLARSLPFDPEVMAEVERLLSNSEELLSTLPSEFEFLCELWRKMQHCDIKDYAKLAKVYADCRGFTKPVAKTQDSDLPKGVLVVPIASTPDDWEKYAVAQQSDLVNRDEPKH